MTEGDKEPISDFAQFIIRSNQIEGYDLDPEEVTEAIEGIEAGYPPTYVTQNPHIFSHLAGIEAAKSGYGSPGDVMRIHSAMGPGALEAGAPGVLRSGVEARSAGGTQYAPSADVPAALSWWAQQGWSSPFEAHTVYELIHPFADGNGRSGRIILAAMMGFNYAAVNGMIGGGYFGSLNSVGEEYQGEFWKE
jgi:Fic family protein